jgi:predicted nucleic acid-binding protein
MATAGYVVDASVALKWVVDEAGSERAVSLAGRPLAAPSLWIAECANALWAKARRGEISSDEARKGLRALLAAPVLLVPTEELVGAAMDFALELDVTVYDALYLAAASNLTATLVTDDRRLAAAAETKGAPPVVRLRDLRI